MCLHMSLNILGDIFPNTLIFFKDAFCSFHTILPCLKVADPATFLACLFIYCLFTQLLINTSEFVLFPH